jgi:hypothetical protein
MFLYTCCYGYFMSLYMELESETCCHLSFASFINKIMKLCSMMLEYIVTGDAIRHRITNVEAYENNLWLVVRTKPKKYQSNVAFENIQAAPIRNHLKRARTQQYWNATPVLRGCILNCKDVIYGFCSSHSLWWELAVNY